MRSGPVLRATTLAALALFSAAAGAVEPHAELLAADTLAARDTVRAASPGEDPLFVAFWDFDGTLLRGDCTEGLEEGGRSVYAGLARRCIEAGLAPAYPAGPDAFGRFAADYGELDRRFGHEVSYPWAVQILAGAAEAEVRGLARRHFADTLAQHYFASSVQILRTLESAGIRNHVLSASADAYVDAAAETLPLPAARIHGIELQVDAEGRFGRDLVPPVAFGEGKVQKLLQIVARLHAAHPGRRVVVLAGFGNSHATDGPFLEYIARQALPGGARPVVAMINGGAEPPRFAGLFRNVRQSETVGSPRPSERER